MKEGKISLFLETIFGCQLALIFSTLFLCTLLTSPEHGPNQGILTWRGG